MYTAMQAAIPNIEFIQDIPANINDDNFTDISQPALFILDEMMRSSSNSVDISELYTEGSHHRNISIISLLQNLFSKGKEARTISLNNHYLALFKNPRDMQQISVLARQMYPGNGQHFMHKFKEATSKPYGTLVVDLKPDTQERDRLKIHDWPPKKPSKCDPGLGPERLQVDDTTAFREWIHDVIKSNDEQWHQLIDDYKEHGMTQTNAEKKAENELDDQKSFYQRYQTLLKNLMPLEQSLLHHMIISSIEDLLENSLPIDTAIKNALKHHQPHFDKLFSDIN